MSLESRGAERYETRTAAALVSLTRYPDRGVRILGLDVWAVGFHCRAELSDFALQLESDQIHRTLERLQAAVSMEVVASLQSPRQNLAQIRDVSLERSILTLCKFLTRKQLDSFYRIGSFETRGQDGQWWKIYAKASYNVSLGDTAYCVTPVRYFPPGDTILISKLLVESDLNTFLRIANRSSLRFHRLEPILLESIRHIIEAKIL